MAYPVRIDLGELPELGRQPANFGATRQGDPALSATGDLWLVAVIYLYEADRENDP